MPSGKQSAWPNPAIINSSIEIDTGFDSRKSAILEASFILLMKGWIPKGDGTGQLSLSDMRFRPSIIDEFRFLRRHFNPAWIIIYFLYCILTFKNPFQVIYGFCKAIRIKQQPLFSNPIGRTTIPEDDEFSLIRQKKSVRIIIPTYNRYDVLDDVLRDLERLDYAYFSVTVVDQSDPYNESFYDKYKLDINLIRQKNPGLWRARNQAILHSTEEIIALIDDDSRISADWLRKHLQCLDFFGAEISAGVSISKVGARVPENYSFYRLSDQLDTGNVVLRRSVFEICGLFDEQFEGLRMGDGEFGLRAHKEGILSISNPEARRYHLKLESGGLRQVGSWDALRPTRFFQPKPIPSVIYLACTHFGKSVAWRYILTSVPFSFSPYSWKSTLRGDMLSLFLFIVLLPLVVFQVSWSWLVASSLIKEGPIINQLFPLGTE